MLHDAVLLPFMLFSRNENQIAEPPPKRNKRLIVTIHDRSTLGTTLGTI